MNITTLVGQYAYAVIEENGRRTDIRLSPGKSPASSLSAYAEELRQEAKRKTDLADLCDRAAAHLSPPQYLSAGDTLWNGKVVTAFLAASYNRLTDRIENMRARGERIPETLADSRFRLIA
ncbi:hypothetical protein [Tardiphaga sp.]|uniref:hypothetical protein n=1 Tax=Tardiphaga sp. TaxID=1926292 RepID=UPI00352A6456